MLLGGNAPMHKIKLPSSKEKNLVLPINDWQRPQEHLASVAWSASRFYIAGLQDDLEACPLCEGN
jgi:hypothetical protein